MDSIEIPDYKIEKVIGVGGMSTVYLATQNSFGRKVALKVMDSSQMAHQDVAIRFAREAKIIASLSHPHIVPVHDVANYGALHYMSMDYLDGGDLAQHIERGLAVEEVLRITGNIASALHAAHNKGYIHRDIKPTNILFRSDGSPVLTDFGISRLLNANDDLTKSGAIIGTPRYMSPESLQGKPLDGRSDLYSLGVVFYEMLMKEAPYQSEEYMALGLKHINDPIPVLPEHLERFQELLTKLMAKNPDHRYRSGSEVVNAIQQIQTGSHPNRHKKPTPFPMASYRSKEKTEFSEASTRKLGIFKRYIFTCDITVYDAASFSMIFSSLTTRLLEWRKKRGGQGAGLTIRLTATPTVIELAKTRISRLCQSEKPYDFVKKLDISVIIKNIDDGDEAIYLPDR